MSSDPEFDRLHQIEQKACSLLDRLRSNATMLSDPSVLESAEELCESARAAMHAYLAQRSQTH